MHQSSLQVFVEPVKHVSKSFFSRSDGKRVGGIISASKSMCNSWKDLGEVWYLQERMSQKSIVYLLVQWYAVPLMSVRTHLCSLTQDLHKLVH
jgi:hypothetical protein